MREAYARARTSQNNSANRSLRKEEAADEGEEKVKVLYQVVERLGGLLGLEGIGAYGEIEEGREDGELIEELVDD